MNRHSGWLHRLGVSVIVSAFIAGCGGGGGATNTPPPAPPPPPAPTLTSITLSQNAVTLDRWGDTASISAQPVDQNGNNIGGATITWSSADDTIAAVDNLGNITSWLGGNVDLTVDATLGGTVVSDTVTVTVAIQQNPNCQVPPGFPVQGPVNPPSLWDVVTLPTQTIPPGASPGQFEIARQITLDADRDGDPDLISLTHSSESQGIGVPIETDARVWLNDGTGAFSDGTAAILGANIIPWNAPRNMDYADFDGDSFRDVVVFQQGWEQDPAGCGTTGSCLGGPNLLLSPQPGGLSDSAPVRLSPYDTDGFTHSGAIGDVDCDGDIDIFEAQWANSDAVAPHRLQLNTGAGTFVSDATLLPSVFLPDQGINSAALCDLDRDGDPDLVTGTPDPTQVGAVSQFVRISVNDGFGNFRLLDSDVMVDIESADGAACADLDLDGYNDIVLSVGIDMEIHRNQGDMSFANVTAAALPANPRILTSNGLGIIDLNDDGWPEITPGNDRATYWNTGAGNFAATPFPDACCGNFMTAADFDMDGLPDIYQHSSTHPDTPNVLFLNRPPPAAVKTVFATSQTYTANLGGLAGADAICQQHATNAGLPGNYVAFLSDSVNDAISRVSHGEYRRTSDDLVVASSKIPLIDTGLGLANAVANDETGAPIVGNVNVWTGTNTRGHKKIGVDTAFCSDWTRDTNDAPGTSTVGNAAVSDQNWVETEDRACSELHRLYCFRQ